MKPIYLLAATLVSIVPLANAVDLNKDALKAMQQEGHKIVEESKGGRNYKTGNGLCMDFAGAVMLVKQCNNKPTQKWSFDGEGRLVASDKRCVAGAAQMQQCGSGNGQKWKLDGKKRLVNANNKCLQVQGNPAKAGAKVVVANCSNGANQVWK